MGSSFGSQVVDSVEIDSLIGSRRKASRGMEMLVLILTTFEIADYERRKSQLSLPEGTMREDLPPFLSSSGTEHPSNRRTSQSCNFDSGSRTRRLLTSHEAG